MSEYLYRVYAGEGKPPKLYQVEIKSRGDRRTVIADYIAAFGFRCQFGTQDTFDMESPKKAWEFYLRTQQAAQKQALLMSERASFNCAAALEALEALSEG